MTYPHGIGINPAKVYLGVRPVDDDIARIIAVQHRRAHPLRAVNWHGSRGLDWGYVGNSPKDAALSILLDYFAERLRPGMTSDDSRALEFCLPFATQIIACQPRTGFALTERGIRQWFGEPPGDEIAIGLDA